METIQGFLHNQVLISTIFAWFIAQGAKIIILIVKGQFTIERLTSGGGMPSAHSSTVVGLTTSTLIVCGSSSSQFAIALFLAIIVIYDARGVRYTTGQQSKILNHMRLRDQDEGRKPVQDNELEEHMGHTIPELIAGIITGLLTALVISLFC